MPTAYEDIYTAAKSIIGDASTASTTNITQAPTNYGTDFAITPGAAVYQVILTPLPDYPRATVNYPRANVEVRIHHYASSLANEEAFLHSTLFQVAERWLVPATWSAEPGIFGLDPTDDPEVEAGDRVGNVISFSLSAVVLADAT